MAQHRNRATSQQTQQARQSQQPRDRNEPELRKEHRWALLQALMSRSCMKESECKQLLRRICDVENDRFYQQALQAINEDMAFAKLKAMTILNPIDQIRYVGLVNTEADDITKMGTHYTIPQREFFIAVVDHIATQPDMVEGPGTPYESQTQLLNLDVPASMQQPPGGGEGTSQAAPAAGTQLAGAKTLSKLERERTLILLAKDGWLSPVPGRPGCLCLGPRTLLELGHYLLELELPEGTRTAWQALV